MIPTRSQLRKRIARLINQELFWTQSTIINEVSQQDYENIADKILDLIDNDRKETS